MVFTTLSLLGREAARIVLPAPCIVCARELPWSERKASCCLSCWAALPRIDELKCVTCALPWSGDADSFVCGSCRDDPPDVEWAEAWGHYRGGLEPVLQAFKFGQHDFLAGPLSERLAETYRRRMDTDFDAVVPVPMHRSRLRRRGYNQAELLARAFASLTALSCRPELLEKRMERKTQSTLARADRAANVRNVFSASPAAKGLSLLLIDDIATTGETLRACATAFRRAGSRRVCTLALARA